MKNWEDLKGRKCRETGITAEVFSKSGMNTVNMPGGDIIPSGQRGVIDCAEFVGPAEDMKIGFQSIWKYAYMPSTHEPATVGELIINADVWKKLPDYQKEVIKSATMEATLRSQLVMNTLNAEALVELKEKHGVTVARTPEDILTKTLETWDQIAKEGRRRSLLQETLRGAAQLRVARCAGPARCLPTVRAQRQLLLAGEEIEPARAQQRVAPRVESARLEWPHVGDIHSIVQLEPTIVRITLVGAVAAQTIKSAGGLAAAAIAELPDHAAEIEAPSHARGGWTRDLEERIGGGRKGAQLRRVAGEPAGVCESQLQGELPDARVLVSQRARLQVGATMLVALMRVGIRCLSLIQGSRAGLDKEISKVSAAIGAAASGVA